MKRYINLKLWDGVSDELRPAELCVADGKLSDGAAEEAGVEDLQGGVVIPGLIDAHIHLCLDPDVRKSWTGACTDRQRCVVVIRAG